MIKRSLFCALLGVLMGSCASPSYTLTGSCWGFNDGDTVFINTMDRTTAESRVIDSCVVKNGQFFFQGRQDNPICVNLKSMKNGKLHKLTGKFFLENGNIIAKGDSIYWSVTGSPYNDIYQRCLDECTPHLLKIWELSEKLDNDTKLTNEQRQAYRTEIKKESEAISKIKQKYFENNLNNVIGLELFYSHINTYDIKKQKELTDHFYDMWPNDYFVNKHKERVDKRMKSIVGEKFIDYTMQTPDGKMVKLSDFVNKNKYTLVDIWASWCTPYPSTKPYLETAYKTYKDKGLEIVGVSLDTDSDEWKEAIQKWGMPWPQMSDLKGWKSQAVTLYAINTAPHLLLIDQEGTIVARNIRASELDKVLKEFLK